MLITWGTGQYGKCDQVKGLFYVVTNFFYVQFVPLIPLGSYCVHEGTKGQDGVKIPFSFKSWFFTYVRCAIVLATPMFGLVAYQMVHKSTKNEWAGAGGYAAVVVVGVLAYWLSRVISRASYRRALYLARQLGVDEEQVDLAFGMTEQSEHDSFEPGRRVDEPAVAQTSQPRRLEDLDDDAGDHPMLKEFNKHN